MPEKLLFQEWSVSNQNTRFVHTAWSEVPSGTLNQRTRDRDALGSEICRVNQKYHDGRLVTENPFALTLVVTVIVAVSRRRQELSMSNEKRTTDYYLMFNLVTQKYHVSCLVTETIFLLQQQLLWRSGRSKVLPISNEHGSSPKLVVKVKVSAS